MLTNNRWSLPEFRNLKGSMSRVSGEKDGSHYEFLNFGVTAVSFSHKLGTVSKDYMKAHMADLQVVEGVDDETGATFFCLCNKGENNSVSEDDIFG